MIGDHTTPYKGQADGPGQNPTGGHATYLNIIVVGLNHIANKQKLISSPDWSKLVLVVELAYRESLPMIDLVRIQRIMCTTCKRHL